MEIQAGSHIPRTAPCEGYHMVTKATKSPFNKCLKSRGCW